MTRKTITEKLPEIETALEKYNASDLIGNDLNSTLKKIREILPPKTRLWFFCNPIIIEHVIEILTTKIKEEFNFDINSSELKNIYNQELEIDQIIQILTQLIGETPTIAIPIINFIIIILEGKREKILSLNTDQPPTKDIKKTNASLEKVRETLKGLKNLKKTTV